jgi:group I intron endonuclease
MERSQRTSVIQKPQGIYQITNIETGKFYVGSSMNLRKRWNGHVSQLQRGKHPNVHLQRAWDIDGAEAFEFTVLEYVEDIANLLPLEQHWMDRLDAALHGYNFCTRAGSRLGTKQSEEAKRKISEGGKGLKRSDETRKRMSESFKSRTLSLEHRKKLSEAQRARSPESRARQAAKLIGRKLSPESIAKREATKRTNWLRTRDVSNQIPGDSL